MENPDVFMTFYGLIIKVNNLHTSRVFPPKILKSK